ncbi:ribonuclease P protein component [Candidatus Beckwithbacteria bacterium]|nr:ribonuclease P protein component [Candidatus Beckwithbacteria bacterium]
MPFVFTKLPNDLIYVVLKSGKAVDFTNFYFKYISNQEMGLRWQVVFSLKIDKRACVRNKNKRIVKECVRMALVNARTNKNLDLLIVIKKRIDLLDFKTIKTEIGQGINKLNYL